MTSRQPTTPTTGEDDVERVARALYIAEWAPGYGPPDEWETVVAEDPEMAGAWRASARAALAAISPTTEDAEKRELVEALKTIVAGNFNCSPHQRFMAAQGVAERALASIGERS